MLPIYLDYAASSPVDKRVMEQMLPYFTEHFGNASSRFHAYGWEAEEALHTAKEKIANNLKCDSKEIFFTSGATESINLALKGVFENNKGHLITVSTEHKAVIDTALYLQKQGHSITFLKVDGNGQIDLTELENCIRPDTKAISVMQVNNETGLKMPIDKITALAKKHKVLLHVDASQAIGKSHINENVDLVSFSVHKFYGPKGVGLLKVKKGTPLISQIHGGKHQRSLRSGTLNIPGIVGAGAAFDLAFKEMNKEQEKIQKIKNSFEKNLLSSLPFVQINAQNVDRVANVSNICFTGIDGEELLGKLSKIAVSNGSACNSADTEPSHVLKAMGLSSEDAFSSIRFSLGRYTTQNEMFNALDHVIETVKKLC